MSNLNGILENPDEQSYLDLVGRIISEGSVRENRTGINTRSIFGAQLRYNLSEDTMPVFTTKRVYWKGVLEELFWFIGGKTDSRLLSAKNVHIWDANGSREYLDSIGLKDREDGDLGPVYGFQWRHFGAQYTDSHADYREKGVDQLKWLISEIKNNPTSRRLIMSAWNPMDLNEMALPPCHVMCQFYVQSNELSCQMYQRSADMGLGVPFNVASYSLLTHLIAHVTGLRAKEFIHSIGDAHVYENHIKPLEEQLKRKPLRFPRLKITNDCTDIDSLKPEHVELVGYKPMAKIQMDMAV
ncbi:hypothetical protein ACOME3_002015 [Neoechinorhynchus agilis]